MRVAYSIVERSGREHPFSNRMAGRAWFDRFRSCHPNLTIHYQKSRSRWILHVCVKFHDFLCVAGTCPVISLLTGCPLCLWNRPWPSLLSLQVLSRKISKENGKFYSVLRFARPLITKSDPNAITFGLNTSLGEQQ